MKDKRIILRVTEEELGLIRALADKAGISVSAFLLTKALKSKTEFKSAEEIRALRDLKIELQRQGNNINQIARKVNNKLNPVSAAMITKQLMRIREELEEIKNGYYKIRVR